MPAAAQNHRAGRAAYGEVRGPFACDFLPAEEQPDEPPLDTEPVGASARHGLVDDSRDSGLGERKLVCKIIPCPSTRKGHNAIRKREAEAKKFNYIWRRFVL